MPRLVLPTIATALGIKEIGGEPVLERLIGHLHKKRLLLVLDNFEHLLPAAEGVSCLVDSCSELMILVTSRTILHLSAEQEYPVAPFPIPVPSRVPDVNTLGHYGAIQLFVQRAQAVRPDFQLTPENAQSLAEICCRLDGLPLAIELAAVCVRLFLPQTLRARLARRLSLLTSGPRDAPVRQRTLRNTIDWSYHLLSSPQQTLFRRLSVFAGGCTLEAAEQVCNPGGEQDLDVLEGLTALVEQSLEQAGGEEESRFVMLETIREYALERLEASGENEQLKWRHAEWYLALAEEAALELRGPAQAVWLERLEREHDNLRAALGWLTDRGEVELGLRLAIVVSRFWQIRGYLSEGRKWLTELLAAREYIVPSLRAPALLCAGELSFAQARNREAAERFEQSLALYRELDDWKGVSEALGRLADALSSLREDQRTVGLLTQFVRLGREVGNRSLLATCLWRLARQAELRRDTEQARMLGEESLPLLRELGEARATAHALQVIATAAYRDGDVARARPLVDEIVALMRHANLDEEDHAWGHHRLVFAARDQGDYDPARRLMEALEARALELGDRRNIAFARQILATLAREQGDYDRARVLADQTLAMAQEAGDPWRIGFALVTLGDVARDQGDAERVIELCEQALMLFRELDEPDSWDACFPLHSLGLAARYQGNYERAEALMEESLPMFRKTGRVEYSSEVFTSLGLVALEQGQHARARQAFYESLMLGCTWMLATTLEGLAGVAFEQGQPKRAASLFGAAASIRNTMGTPRWPPNESLYQRYVAAAKEALGEERYIWVCTEGRAMTSEESIAYALNQTSEAAETAGLQAG